MLGRCGEVKYQQLLSLRRHGSGIGIDGCKAGKCGDARVDGRVEAKGGSKFSFSHGRVGWV